MTIPFDQPQGNEVALFEAAYAARLRTRAAQKEARAVKLHADADKANDAQAETLLDEAAEDRANADALEALKSRR